MCNLSPIVVIRSIVSTLFRILRPLLSLVLFLLLICILVALFLLRVVQFSLFSLFGLFLHYSLLSYFSVSPLFGYFKRYYHLPYSSLLLLFSRVCILRKPRYRESTVGSQCVYDCERRKICPMCKGIVESSPLLIGTHWGFTRPVEKHLHHTTEGLEKSAEDCHLCNLFLRSMNSARCRIASERPSQYGTISLSDPKKDALTVKVWEERLLFEKPLLRLQLVFGECKTEPLIVEEFHIGTVPHECETPGRTDSPTILYWAGAQIKFCQDHHSICKNYFVSNDEKGFLPTRVLDVGQDDTSKVLLVETSKLQTPKTLRYVALSHCWGGDIATRLDKKNIESWKKSVPHEELSTNFQHAISITRGIGFQYLWIDSICIIQDCEQDKEHEIKRMGLVYTNAVCTVSATASGNSQGGCFFPKERFLGDCSLRKQGDMSLIVTLPAREDSALGELFRNKVETEPLTKRAWAFQERVLASRVLHFCNGIVLFECNETQASSCHGYGKPYATKKHVRADGKLSYSVGPPQPPPPPHPLFPPRLSHAPLIPLPSFEPGPLGNFFNIREFFRLPSFSAVYSLEDFFDFYDFRQSFGSFTKYASWRPHVIEVAEMSARLGIRGAFEMLVRFEGQNLQEQMEFHESWYQIVQQYSSREMTRRTDKVRAIEGIAYFIGKKRSLKFSAGLWMDFLPFNLLWMLPEPSTKKRDQSLPTWSWASVDGCVSQRLSRSSEISRITWKEIDILISVPPMSADSSAALERTLEFTCHHLELDLGKVEFLPDVNPNLSAERPTEQLTQHSTEKLICVPIVSLQNTSTFYGCKRLQQLHGIVLRVKSGADDEAVFARVGYFWTEERAVAREILGSLGPRDTIRVV